MGKRFAGAAVVLALTTSCGTAVSNSSDRIAPRDSQTPTPAPAGMQQYWLRGVGVDAPSDWKPDDTQCGTPMANTVIIDYSGSVTPACLITSPPKHLSVIKLQVAKGTSEERDKNGQHERVIAFPDRGVLLSITSPDQSVIDAVARSVQTVDTDPETGCVVHTNAYDDGKPPAQGNAPELLPGHPTSATGCVYVSGWLEQSARVTGDKLTALVNAVQAAPAPTDLHAPDDANCESVADSMTPDDNPPMALHFDYSDSSTWTVVAKISPCTRWQSTVSSGSVTRRIDQQLLLALPSLWNQFPSPDSMDP